MISFSNSSSKELSTAKKSISSSRHLRNGEQREVSDDEAISPQAKSSADISNATTRERDPKRSDESSLYDDDGNEELHDDRTRLTDDRTRLTGVDSHTTANSKQKQKRKKIQSSPDYFDIGDASLDMASLVVDADSRDELINNFPVPGRILQQLRSDKWRINIRKDGKISRELIPEVQEIITRYFYYKISTDVLSLNAILETVQECSTPDFFINGRTLISYEVKNLLIMEGAFRRKFQNKHYHFKTIILQGLELVLDPSHSRCRWLTAEVSAMLISGLKAHSLSNSLREQQRNDKDLPVQSILEMIIVNFDLLDDPEDASSYLERISSEMEAFVLAALITKINGGNCFIIGSRNAGRTKEVNRIIVNLASTLVPALHFERGRCDVEFYDRCRFIKDFITVQKKRPEPDFLPPDDFVDEDHPEEKDYPVWKRKRNVLNRLKEKQGAALLAQNVDKVVLTGGDISSDVSTLTCSTSSTFTSSSFFQDRARPLDQSHQYQSRSLLAPDTYGASPDPRQSSRPLPPKFSYGEDEDEESEDHDDQLLTPGIGDDERGGDKMKNSLRLPPNSTVTTSWDSLLGEQQETTKGRTKNVTTTISGHTSSEKEKKKQTTSKQKNKPMTPRRNIKKKK